MAVAHIFSGSAQAVAGFFRTAAGFDVANTTWVKAIYGTTGYDYGGILDSANSRFLVPEDGIYVVTFKAVYEADADGYRALGVYRNEGLDEYVNMLPVPGQGTEMATTYHPRGYAGDRFEFYFWHNAGALLSNCFGEFYIAKVGDLS